MTQPSGELARLGPVAQLQAGRLPRRLTQLLLGLVLFGITIGMMIRAAVGNAPWDVFHQGLAEQLPITIGQAVILVSIVVLLFWIPIRELPGLGTVLNTVVVGLVADATLVLLDEPSHLWARGLLFVGGVVLNGLATGLYIGSQFGPGPRDGLMTGLHRRTGIPIGLVRTVLEVSVVLAGWWLGGTIGIGTIVFALAIGPLVQLFLPICIVSLPTPDRD
ncbi:MAG TPA: hypothetical protein PKM12_04105 [Marmoricola sp.]|nr:hypothetical protein [Marmoricola sp.]HNN48127.1 hypothetical protein [Marmoricola sp.]HNO38874.1 hypothetical protein [Marmoricola sp.]